MLSETEKSQIIDRVVKKAGDYEEESISCAQGTMAALQEEFDLPGGRELLVKAATFMPGLASRGETCGALVAGLMALGLIFGKEKLSDPSYNTPEGKEEFRRNKTRAWRLCEEFKQEWGSTRCGDIRPQIMGREYDMWDPKEWDQFLADGGTEKCRKPPERAASIFARIILEGR